MSGTVALTVDGIVQSVEPWSVRGETGYWSGMLPERRPASALILGLGGGTLAVMLRRRFGERLRIVGVDHDPLMPELGRQRLGLASADVHFVEADAAAYLRADSEQFGYIAVDLYTADAFEPVALRKPFLRALLRRLAPDGEVVFNLWSDRRLKRRLARIGAVLHLHHRVDIGTNALIFYGHPDAAVE